MHKKWQGIFFSNIVYIGLIFGFKPVIKFERFMIGPLKICEVGTSDPLHLQKSNVTPSLMSLGFFARCTQPCETCPQSEWSLIAAENFGYLSAGESARPESGKLFPLILRI